MQRPLHHLAGSRWLTRAALCALSLSGAATPAAAQSPVAVQPPGSYTSLDAAWRTRVGEGALGTAKQAGGDRPGDGTGGGVALLANGRYRDFLASLGDSLTTTHRAGSPRVPDAQAQAAALVLSTAQSFEGTRYRWGGTSPVTGFDCSGFVGYVYASEGIELPRTARAIATAGVALPKDWDLLRPGDLVLFANRGRRISHIAIYAGSRRIIHATSSRGRVRYDDIDSPRGTWYKRRMVGARRVLPAGVSTADDLLDTRPVAEITVSAMK